MASSKKMEKHVNEMLRHEETATEELKDWDSIGGYMKMKNKKLNEQFQDQFEKKSNIFHGVSIWINGYTEPSSDELKRLMAEHGGKHQHFFSKTHVTHVIAINLPTSKIKNLKQNDKVVHPQWIVDSVKDGRLLSIDKYLLYSVAKRDGDKITFPKNNKNKHMHMQADNNQNDTFTEAMDTTDGVESNEAHNDGIEKSYMMSPSNQTASTSAPHLTRHNYSSSTISKAPLKAGDDNFISEFYTHSRLHHLAMWKTELKKFTSSIQQKRKTSGRISEHSRKLNEKEMFIMHVDLDSFFVSVAIKMNPELIGKPVAVCHSGRGNTQGKSLEKSWSEIASCSYEARRYGLRNGMMLNKAKKLCPSVICVPYYFDEYKNVSEKFYEILSSFTYDIEAVSCDEALLDITAIMKEGKSVHEIAESIRAAILSNTGCTASCGIGNSILIARLATKRAKPNGVCFIAEEEIPNFIGSQKVSDLPGVGWAQGQKLHAMNISVCSELQKISLQYLQKEFGQKHGETLYKYCRGQDNRIIHLEHERKSVSAEINYGMRFKGYHEVEKFVYQLATEVENRLKEIEKVGSHLTLKLMTRRQDAAEPAKYMGHGYCNSISKSTTLPQPTQSGIVIGEKCFNILRPLKIMAEDFRGMGIQITKLSDVTKQQNVMNMEKFTKRISVEELYEKDRVQTINTTTTTRKNITIDAMLESSTSKKVKTPGNEGLIQTGIDKSRDLPPLPSFEEISRPYLSNVPTGSGNACQGPSSAWDPEILNELPRDIRKELETYQNQQSMNSIRQKRTASENLSTRSPNSNRSMKSSKSSKSPTQRNIPKNIKPKKSIKFDSTKYGDVRKAVQQQPKRELYINLTDIITQPNNSSSVSLDRPECVGMLSPSQIDIGVVNELPDEIKNEIVLNMRMSGHLSTHSKGELRKINNNKSKVDVPKDTTNAKGSDKAIVNTPSKEISCYSNLLSPSQLDESVLQALPEDLREDVMSEARKVRKQRKQRNKSNTLVTPTLPLKVNSSLQINTQNLNTKQTDSCRSVLLSPSQIDPNFLEALPTDLQREVIQQAKTEKRNRERMAHSTVQGDVLKTDNIPVVENTVEPPTKLKLKQILPEICGASEYEDVKKLLRQWVQEYEEPLPVDIEEMTIYCKKLLTSFNMETLQQTLSFLRRRLFVRMEGSHYTCKWRYFVIYCSAAVSRQNIGLVDTVIPCWQVFQSQPKCC